MRIVAAMMTAAVLTVTIAARALPEKPKTADEIMSRAYAAAKPGKKPVLVVFGATWCPWCHKLDDFLAKEENRRIIEGSFVVVHLDVNETGDKIATDENPGGQKLLADLGGAKSGLPFYAIVDAAGKKLGDSNAMDKSANIGYPATPEEIAAFMKLVRSTARKMKSSELEMLESNLRAAAPKQAVPAGAAGK